MRLYTQSQQSPLQTLGTRHTQGRRLSCRNIFSHTHIKYAHTQPWAPKQTNTKGHTDMASVFGKNLVATSAALFMSLVDWHPVHSFEVGVGDLDKTQQK